MFQLHEELLRYQENDTVIESEISIPDMNPTEVEERLDGTLH